MFAILLLICGVSVAKDSLPAACGYKGCPKYKSDFLNIHIVPVYQMGGAKWSKIDDSSTEVRVIDVLVDKLLSNEKVKLSIGEIGLFWQWWEMKSEFIRGKVRNLVHTGRLQFVGGGWKTNDEAITHYQSIIDQFTWGLSKLSRNFGECGVPHVSWQYEQFGHARELVSLLAAMGYDGLFLGRIDSHDRLIRKHNKTMEMLWRGDDSLGSQSDMFTSVLYYPPRADLDKKRFRIVPGSFEKISWMANELVRIARDKMTTSYTTNNFLVTLEEALQSKDVGSWFTLINYVIIKANDDATKYKTKIKVFFSTPDCYLKAVHDAEPYVPIKQDDFFPYSEGGDYWTGYYTTGASLSYFERVGNSYLQMAKQLQLLAGLKDDKVKALENFKRVMGVMQHDYSLTGQISNAQYMLDEAIEEALIVIRQAFNKIMHLEVNKQAEVHKQVNVTRSDKVKEQDKVNNQSKVNIKTYDVNKPVLSFDRCQLNESSCETSESSNQFVVTVYNHLAWLVNQPISIPVLEGVYYVYAPDGQKVVSQLVDIPKAVLELATRDSDATHEIVFIARLQPVSFKSFYVQKITKHFKRNVEDWVDEIKVEETVEVFEPKKSEVTTEIDSKNEEQLDKKANTLATDQTVTDEMADDEEEEDLSSSISTTTSAGLVQSSPMKKYTENQDPVVTITEEPMELINLEVGARAPVKPVVYPSWDEETALIGNKHVKLRIDGGAITHVVLPGGMDFKFGINFCYYPSVDDKRNPYIFKPYSNTPYERIYNLTKGPFGEVVKEVRISSANKVEAYVRIYDDLKFVEIDWVVGPVDVGDGIGKQYIVRYTTNVVNNGEFYTDSLGRQVIKRILNKRPQYGVNVTQPVAGNYYPVTNKIYIEDDTKRVAVLTDRAEGGASLYEGQIELMLYRGLQTHKARVAEDSEYLEQLTTPTSGQASAVRGKHRIAISVTTKKEDYINEKKQVIELHLQPLVFISNVNLTLEQWFAMKNTRSFVYELPEGIHLLTLEYWFENTMLLRLENYLDNTDKLVPYIEVDLSNIFKTITLLSFKETTLAANKWVEENVRWTWWQGSYFYNNFNEAYGNVYELKKTKDTEQLLDDGFIIKLQPKQIKTFVVRYKLNN